MNAATPQNTSLTIVYSIVYWGADQRKPVNSPHKWPVTRKMFPFDDVIMLGLHRMTLRMQIEDILTLRYQICGKMPYAATRCYLTNHWNGRNTRDTFKLPPNDTTSPDRYDCAQCEQLYIYLFSVMIFISQRKYVMYLSKRVHVTLLVLFFGFWVKTNVNLLMTGGN